MGKLPIYYYQCGNCNTGTVVNAPDQFAGAKIAAGAIPGAIGGALFLGVISFGFLAPLGAVLGAGAGGKDIYKHDCACDTCGAIYAYDMVKILREKALTKAVPQRAVTFTPKANETFSTCPACHVAVSSKARFCQHCKIEFKRGKS